MRDALKEAKTEIENYDRALDLKNGQSARFHRVHIEKESVSWLRDLITECTVQRLYGGIPLDTVAVLANAILPEEPKYFIYVCSPCRGNVQKNIAAARGYCERVIERGYMPLAPHVMFSGILNDDIPEQRTAGIALGKQMLRYCRELWVFGDRVSEGMRDEIKLAKYLNIPVRRYDEICPNMPKTQTCQVKFQGLKLSAL